ncbi:hypothetical protein BSN85_15740 [Bradyrhizobium brasilense]|nr:hypothetical protein BSN85_15740 [Bradyrhizobium brasilense]
MILLDDDAQPVNGGEWHWLRMAARLQGIRARRRGGRSGAAVDGESNVQSRTEPVSIHRQSQRTMIRVSSLSIVMTTNAHFD